MQTTVEPTTVATTLFEQLERAWNDADGQAFGAEFAEESEFVNIRGEHHRGTQAIAHGHQGIFDTIYAGSTVELRVEIAREIAPGRLHKFRAFGTFSDGSKQDLTDLVTWSSANSGAATISNALGSGGLATGLSPAISHITAKLDDIFGDYDVMLTPAAFGEAPVGLFDFDGVPLFQIWTALHLPVISLPVFKGPNNLPVGLQLIAKRHDDRRLFACARWAWQKLT